MFIMLSTYKFKMTHFVRITLVVLLFSISACSSDDDGDGPTTLPEENKTTGFVITGTTSSGTALVKYFEELPEGTIDLSDGTDFPNFFPTSIMDGAIFLTRPDGAAGFSKYVVNADGELEEEGTIVTADAGSFRIAARNSNSGVFQDRATPNIITTFDPTTFQVTGSIDMSAGFVPGDVDQRYQRFVFRGDDVFAPIRENGGAQFTSFILHQANLGNNSFVGDTQRDGNGVATINTFNNFGQDLLDPSGNLYIADAGNYEAQGVAARVNKIPAGSNEIDANYVFEPAVVLNPANIFLPTFNNLRVLPNGKAVARVNSETPQAAIDIVLGAGGIGNLSPDEIQQIFGILFTAESAVWCELDLVNLSVTPIQGIPAVGVFSAGQEFFGDDGNFYIPVVTPQENSYYRWNYTTGETELAFTVTGADILGGFNIGKDN
jgi:hypothetical protein